jgi:uncharacterized Zn finger protein (UPF0148 family)
MGTMRPVLGNQFPETGLIHCPPKLHCSHEKNQKVELNQEMPAKKRGRPTRAKPATKKVKKTTDKNSVATQLEKFLIDSGSISHMLSERDLEKEIIPLSVQSERIRQYKHKMEIKVFRLLL